MKYKRNTKGTTKAAGQREEVDYHLESGPPTNGLERGKRFIEQNENTTGKQRRHSHGRQHRSQPTDGQEIRFLRP